VAALYLYGSYARDEAGPNSDIDILVDLEADKDLVASMAPYALLEGEFPGIEIGYGTRDNIVPAYRHHIESGAFRVF
jgi:predicted nucleotidyltransferase